LSLKDFAPGKKKRREEEVDGGGGCCDAATKGDVNEEWRSATRMIVQVWWIILLPTLKSYSCELESLTTSAPSPKLHRSTSLLPSTNEHNSFIMVEVEIIEDVVPSSLIATAVTDGGLAPSFPPDSLFQCSSDTDGVLTTFTLRLLSPLHIVVSHELLTLVVSRYVSSFVLVVGAMLMWRHATALSTIPIHHTFELGALRVQRCREREYR
jgi:hypothetical protein